MIFSMQCLLVQHLYSKKQLFTSLQDDCTTKLCCEHSPSSRHMWCGLADSSASLGLGQLQARGLAKRETHVVIVSIVQRTRSNSLPSGGLMPLSEGGLPPSPYCKQSSNRAAPAHPTTSGFAVLLSSHRAVHCQNQVLCARCFGPLSVRFLPCRSWQVMCRTLQFPCPRHHTAGASLVTEIEENLCCGCRASIWGSHQVRAGLF